MLPTRIVCVSIAFAAACETAYGQETKPLESALEQPAQAARGTPFSSFAQGDGALDQMLASYAFVGGEREQKGIIDAIESVVGDMNVFIRDIARDRLRKSNKAPQSLTIRRDGRRVAVTIDERTYTAELDGAPVIIAGSQGDKLRLTHRLVAGRLVQRFDGDRGGRINTFHLEESGRMRLDVKVHSSQLPKDVVYRLSFSRRG